MVERYIIFIYKRRWKIIKLLLIMIVIFYECYIECGEIYEDCVFVNLWGFLL